MEKESISRYNNITEQIGKFHQHLKSMLFKDS